MNKIEIQKTLDYIYLQIDRINDDIYGYEEKTGGSRAYWLEEIRKSYYDEFRLYSKLLELSIENE